MRYSLKSLIVITSCVCCCLSVPSAYVAGRYSGARAMFDEIEGPFSYKGSHAGVPLYEGGEPAAVFWIQQYTQPGEKRHMTVRKPGCGGHWEVDTEQIVNADVHGIGFSEDADYLQDLLARE